MERWALLAPDFCLFVSLLRDVGSTRPRTRVHYSSLNLFFQGGRPYSPSMTLVLFSLSLVSLFPLFLFFSFFSFFSNVAPESFLIERDIS